VGAQDDIAQVADLAGAAWGGWSRLVDLDVPAIPEVAGHVRRLHEVRRIDAVVGGVGRVELVVHEQQRPARCDGTEQRLDRRLILVTPQDRVLGRDEVVDTPPAGHVVQAGVDQISAATSMLG
jgi:hypothetical protein